MKGHNRAFLSGDLTAAGFVCLAGFFFTVANRLRKTGAR